MSPAWSTEGVPGQQRFGDAVSEGNRKGARADSSSPEDILHQPRYSAATQTGNHFTKALVLVFTDFINLLATISNNFIINKISLRIYGSVLALKNFLKIHLFLCLLVFCMCEQSPWKTEDTEGLQLEY